MTPEEYAARQAVISAAVAAYVSQFLKLFAQPALGIAQWLQLLEFLYPEVARQRREASELARRFFDSQRSEHLPGRHQVLLEEYRFEWFQEAMEPSRLRMQRERSTDFDQGDLTRRVVKEIENGGRRTMIKAVETDPTPRTVKGWARVATGRETCAWCLMLISRGPVFLGADTAGLDLDDTTAQRMIAAGEDVSEHMREWHTGCDCKVVPVYDRRNWVGKDAADRALELWKEATREAEKEWAGMTPAQKEKTTFNNRVINALRRRIDKGEIDPLEWAGIHFAA
ncbi:MAG: hypothetical protein EOO27_20715 [Comamonadaceae bacterium]|nr:MAG: hypothetical protein EOO27_20715 [Comamonadaceae bacterium]